MERLRHEYLKNIATDTLTLQVLPVVLGVLVKNDAFTRRHISHIGPVVLCHNIVARVTLCLPLEPVILRLTKHNPGYQSPLTASHI